VTPPGDMSEQIQETRSRGVGSDSGRRLGVRVCRDETGFG